MQDSLFRALHTHQPALRQRWECRLRAVPPTSALASPDLLVHLMDSTLERFFDGLMEPSRRRRPGRYRTACPCGMNPLLTYYITAEAALLETLFIDEEAWPVLTMKDREDALHVMRGVLQRLAAAEIEAFCSLCRRKTAKQESHSPSLQQAPGHEI